MGLSRESLSRQASVHLNTLTAVENDTTKPSTRILNSLCKVLGLRIELVGN